MRLEQLNCFLTVAETGSFSAAAEKLYTTQSAVSKQVIALERELETFLFERTKRRAVLTRQGEIVREYAEDILKKHQGMLGALRKERESDGGKVSIASIPVMRQYGIIDLMGRFRKENPSVIMSVGEMEGSEILPALEQQRYDMAFFRLEQLSDSAYDSIPFAEDVLTALLPEKHKLAGEKSISLSQLKDEPFLLLNEGTLLHGMCIDACQNSGFIPRIEYTGTRNENIAELVAMGMGVSLVMEKFYLHLRPNGVRCVPLKDCFVSTVGLVRGKKEQHSDAANAFWSYVKAETERK